LLEEKKASRDNLERVELIQTPEEAINLYIKMRTIEKNISSSF
jgi:hypothetical protein